MNRTVTFIVALVYLSLIFALGLLFFLKRQLLFFLPNSFGPVPVGVPWFGALGAVLISLTGAFEHEHDWDEGYWPWHIARPLIGVGLGVVSVLIMQAGVLADECELHIGPCAHDARQDVIEEPRHAVAIRKPAHLADKHEARRIGNGVRSRSRAFHVDAIGHHRDRRPRFETRQFARIVGRTGNHVIGAAARIALEPPELETHVQSYFSPNRSNSSRLCGSKYAASRALNSAGMLRS